MNTQKVKFKGQEIKVPYGTTANQLKNIFNIDKGHFLSLRENNGQLRQIRKNGPHPLGQSELEYVTIPRYIQGFDARITRIEQEIDIVSYQYPVVYDAQTPDYLSVMQFPLNTDYNFTSSTLLILIPDKYPYVPPEHFYLKQDLLYKGQSPKHYFQNPGFNDLENLGWAKYCLHVKSWKPCNDIRSGDSLLTFLELVRFVLDNIEKERPE